MTPQPLYRAESIDPAYHLRYTWSGWLSERPTHDSFTADFWKRLSDQWEGDGFRLLEPSVAGNKIQLCFSTTPDVAPVTLAGRAKGRLQHALRTASLPCEFRRKLAIRSIGDNTTGVVEQYVASQVDRSAYVDPTFKEALKQFTVVNPSVDLSIPTESQSGRYWYNVHVVLVVVERHPIVDLEMLARLRDVPFRIAAKKGHSVAALSVLPDHLHVALRGAIDHSPQDIAMGFLNNTAYAVGQKPIWMAGYYAGTFSEYNMNAVRRRVC